MELRADCANCVGLCCVALRLTRSADFPVDKAAGEPCEHLEADFRCGIHDRLRERGYRGCTVYDCFGAGQQVTRRFAGSLLGADWRSGPAAAERMFAVFHVVRDLHELLWLLEAATALPEAASLQAELAAGSARTVAATHLDAGLLAAYDVEPLRQQVNLLLRRVSELARTRHHGPELSGADLVGHDLRRTPLAGASLRGALLTGADLRGADLDRADVTGADLRGAELSGASLARTIFLTQAQVDSARGDALTILPAGLTRPAWWPEP